MTSPNNIYLKPSIDFSQGFTWVPDIPTSSLAPNEFNDGANVEFNTRGMCKIAGDSEFLSQIPGKIIFMIGGFRAQTNFVFLVASRDDSNNGRWYVVSPSGVSNVTAGVGGNPNVSLPGYVDGLSITADNLGGTFFINDTLGAPYVLTPFMTEMLQYDSGPSAPVWNYETMLGVTSVRANTIRVYNSPHGPLLFAAGITKTLSNGTTAYYPNVVRWSQLFAISSYPTTWEPTVANIANEVQVGLRGPILDGIAFNGKFFFFSYWDVGVMSALNYQSSFTPSFAVQLFNNGRGILNNGCIVNTDQIAYGLDARGVWAFDGGSFTPLSDQINKDFISNSINPTFYDRAFLLNDTYQYQISLFFPSRNSANGYCDKCVSYKYNLHTWSPPRDVRNAAWADEGPSIENGNWNFSKRRIWYASGGITNSKIVQRDTGTSFFGNPINAYFAKENITLEDQQVPYSVKMYVHRALPKIQGDGVLDITIGGSSSVGVSPTYNPTLKYDVPTGNGGKPWVQINKNDVRTVALRIGSNDGDSKWIIPNIQFQVAPTEDNF